MEKKDVWELIEKRAKGFSYTEEVVEYESQKNKKFVFCEHNSRIVFSRRGFVKVKKIFKNDEISSVFHNKIKGFVNFSQFTSVFRLKG